MELYKFPTCSASSCSLVIPCFFVNVIDRRVKVAIRQVDDTWDRYVRFPTRLLRFLFVVVVQAGRVRFIESTVRRYDTMDRIIRQRGQALCQRALSSNRSVSKRLFSDYRVSPAIPLSPFDFARKPNISFHVISSCTRVEESYTRPIVS